MPDDRPNIEALLTFIKRKNNIAALLCPQGMETYLDDEQSNEETIGIAGAAVPLVD